jgi:hypothetical protein
MKKNKKGQISLIKWVKVIISVLKLAVEIWDGLNI